MADTPITYEEIQELSNKLEAAADWVELGKSNGDKGQINSTDFRRIKVILDCSAHLWAVSNTEG